MALLKRPLHRWMGLVLAAPVILWMSTGVLFHVKHRYDEAYEPLEVPRPRADWATASVPPSRLGGELVAVFVHPGGAPAYLVKEGDGARVVDARSGERVAPADEATARGWAMAAVSRSAHAHRYGSVDPGVEETTHLHFNHAAPAFTFTFGGGAKRVTVNRLTAAVSQTGALNDFIDATYRAHYLQWTPWRPVNLALLALAVPLMLGLSATGLWIAFAQRRPAKG